MIDYQLLERYAAGSPDFVEFLNDQDKVSFRLLLLHAEAVKFIANNLGVDVENLTTIDIRPGLPEDVLSYAQVPLVQILWNEDIPEGVDIQPALDDPSKVSFSKVIGDVPLNLVYIACQIDMIYKTYEMVGAKREKELQAMLNGLHRAMEQKRQERSIRQMISSGGGRQGVGEMLGFAEEGPDDDQVFN